MEFSYALFAVFLLTAEVLGTIGGFGSSMLVMPLASWFLPFDQALGLTALFHVFSNGAKMLIFRKGISWKLLLWLGLPAVVFVIIGAQLTIAIEEKALSLTLGAVLVLLGASLLLRPEWKLDATRVNATSGGIISGFIAGIAGTGGAVRGITLAAFSLEKSAFVSTSAWIDMGVDLSRSAVYASHGFMTATVLHYLPLMAMASFLGSWLGKLALDRIDHASFRRIVLALVVIMGGITVLQALN